MYLFYWSPFLSSPLFSSWWNQICSVCSLILKNNKRTCHKVNFTFFETDSFKNITLLPLEILNQLCDWLDLSYLEVNRSKPILTLPLMFSLLADIYMPFLLVLNIHRMIVCCNWPPSKLWFRVLKTSVSNRNWTEFCLCNIRQGKFVPFPPPDK